MFARLAIGGVSMLLLGGSVSCAPVDGEQPATEPAAVAADTKPQDPQPGTAPKYREHQDVNSAVLPAPVAPPASGTPRPPATGMEILANASKDLAKRLGVDAGELEVLAVEAVTWNDGSLGCPQPDRSYTQAQVPGLRILFAHSQKTYQYHAAESGQFLYCANPTQLAAPYARE